MDTLKLQYIRKGQGKTRDDMAKLIGKTVNSYSKKEFGRVKFNDTEKVIIAKELNLTGDEFLEIFFDGKLPVRQ